MDALMGDGAIGGGLAEKGASTMLDSECKKNTSCPSLSLKTRFIAFAICWSLGKCLFMPNAVLCLGIFFSICSVFCSGGKFAIIYAIGTILTLSGSFFLWGPMS